VQLVEARVDLGLVAGRVAAQPNGSETSTSSTTAIRPWLITRRACSGSVTISKKPLPGPPACAST
jgi:hypothetical protein